MKRIGLIGLDSSHAEDFLRHINVERPHHDLRIAAMLGAAPDRMAALRQVSADVAVFEQPNDLIAQVDAVIVGDRDGSLHRAHALPAITAGLPVFIDKPLATSFADGIAIVAAAHSHGTPLLSGSALRWQAETRRLKALIATLEPPIKLVAHGTWYPDSPYGGAIFYAIHAIELALELLGAKFDGVERASRSPYAARYRVGSNRVTLDFRPPNADGSTSFGVSVRAGNIAFDQAITLGDDYMAPVAACIAQMLRTGRSPMSDDELLAPLRLMDAVNAVLSPTAN
jgi:predicted dehydrogenase